MRNLNWNGEEMKSGKRHGSLFTAVLVSVVMNCLLGIVATLAYSQHAQRYPRLARLLDMLGAPSNAVAERLVPPGHDTKHFVGIAIVSIIISVISYAALAWLVPAVWARLHPQAQKQSG